MTQWLKPQGLASRKDASSNPIESKNPNSGLFCSSEPLRSDPATVARGSIAHREQELKPPTVARDGTLTVNMGKNYRVSNAVSLLLFWNTEIVWETGFGLCL